MPDALPVLTGSKHHNPKLLHESERNPPGGFCMLLEVRDNPAANP